MKVRAKKKVNVALLEAEFTALVASVGETIDAKLKQAKALLKEAQELSDQHGVPFFSPISILGENYIPASFRKKYQDLKVDDVADLVGIPPEDLGRVYQSGWDHSEVC